MLCVARRVRFACNTVKHIIGIDYSRRGVDFPRTRGVQAVGGFYNIVRRVIFIRIKQLSVRIVGRCAAVHVIIGMRRLFIRLCAREHHRRRLLRNKVAHCIVAVRPCQFAARFIDRIRLFRTNAHKRIVFILRIAANRIGRLCQIARIIIAVLGYSAGRRRFLNKTACCVVAILRHITQRVCL